MLRSFIKYYRPHLPLFCLDFVCAFIMACLDLVFPIAVKVMIDQVLPAKDMGLLVWAGGSLLFLYILSSLFQYIVDYWGHVVGVRMEYDMRSVLFEHINKLSFTYFDNTKTGQIMSRIVNDLNEISELAHHGPEDLFIALVMLIGSFSILLTMNWQLALVTFAIVPVMLWFAVAKNQKMRMTYRDMRTKIAAINAQVEDTISGIRVVKSFANEWYEERKFAQGNRDFLLSRERALKIMAEFYSGIQFFANSISLVVLVYGGYLTNEGKLTIGELIGFLLYVGVFLQPVRKIANLIDAYQKGMAGFRRFMELMDIHPDIADSDNAKPIGVVRGEIIFTKVAFSYDHRQRILQNINLHINPGETIALVGPSGGGKTTLCSLIPRFYEINEGSIAIDGKDIRNITQKSLRESIGMVQQDVFLFSDSVRENIAYGKIDATDEEIIEAAKRANAHDFILSLEHGYDTFIGERGVKLSGGQKQRIAIARIFLKNPQILLLDEATSALDNETEKVIQESLSALAENRTTIIIAHRLATVRSAHRILVLTDEGIVEEGSHEILLRLGGIYSKLYAAQFDGNLPETLP